MGICNSNPADTSGQLDVSIPKETNRALVFVKPHAQTKGVRDMVRSRLSDSKILVEAEGEIKGPVIDSKKLIDQHYYAIASKATLLKPDELPVPADKFEEKFGISWKEALSAKKAVNAMDACTAFGITSEELEVKWRESEKAGDVVKFGGGFYCGKMIASAQTLYVFNAFFMSMRSKFTAPEASIYYYLVSWDAKVLPWSSFRGNFLGPTDPVAAPTSSIRRMIYDNWEDLGLKGQPNKSDNGVHASASPLEGLAERMNWLEIAAWADPFGQELLKKGLSEARVKSWCKDAQVFVEGDKKGSVFDALEDLNTEECLAKLVDLNALNQPDEASPSLQRSQTK